MEKTKRKNWLITGLLAIALVFTMGFAFLGMPANTMTAYAATERVVATLRASNALNSNGSSGFWSWEMTGSTTVSYTWDTTLNDYVNAVSLPASNPESLFIVRWSNPDSIKITKVVVSAREASGHMKYNQLYFNGDDTASYSNKSTVDNVTTYTQREGREDNGVMRFRVGNNNTTGMSDAVFNIKSITIYAEETTTPVTIDAGTGVKSVYLSTTNNATSGSASGTEFDDGATVYGFAELAKGYNAPSGWTLVGGTANTEGAKYRVGSVSAGSSNFGTKSADLATYTITYNLNGGAHGTTHPSSYNVTSNTFTISNPTRDGYTFKGWSGTGLSGDTNKNVSVAQGSVGNRTYTANWTANQYTITYNANSGTVSPASVTYKTNNNSNTATSQNLTLATPTRAGYTFAGWTTTKSGVSISNKTALTINANTYGDFTVTANWTQDMSTPTVVPYTGTYDGVYHDALSITLTNPSDAVVRYKTSPFGDYSTEIPQVKNGGTYTIYYEIKKDGWTTITSSVNVVINKAALELDPFQTLPIVINNLEYNGQNQPLATAGTLLTDDDYGVIKYRVVAEDGSFDTAYNASIPVGHNVTTYTVYYKTEDSANFVDCPERSITVVIAEVDKTALADKISEVEDYLDTINDKYSTISTTLEGIKDQITADYYTELNVTNEQVEAAVSNLQTALSNAKVDVTETKIDAIGTIAYTTESKALIDDAKAYFDGELSQDEQNMVDSTKKAALNKAYTDYYAVDDVVNQINEIGASEDTPEFRQKVSSARDAYDALTPDQQAIFPADILKILTDDEAAIDVMNKINAIGDVEYNSTSKGKIDVANNAYSALSADQKALVANYTTLTQANTDYDKVDEATGKVNNIGDVEYTQDSKALIDEARVTYDDLTPYQKSIFHDDTLKTLVDDEKAYESMDKVHDIGTIENSQDSKDKIVEARLVYDALTTDQKALVDSTFVTDLENAETVFAVIEKVNDIGKIEYNDDSKALIKKARNEYENLTDEQKLLFPESTVKDIEKAETTYATIEKNAGIISTVFLIFSVLLLIAGIIVMILLLKKRNELKKERSTKLLSVAGLPMLLAATSHYFDAPFIALYVLAFLTICVWVADLIIYLNNRKLKQAIAEAQAEELEDDNVTENHELAGLNDKIRPVYEELKREILSYNGTKAKMGKRFEYIKLGRETILKFAVKDKALCVYYDVDVDNLNSKYMVEQERSRNSAGVTCVYKIKNYRRLNYAKQIIALVAKEFGLEK
ncbi:MAG: InlB B-repeat-containing protein [Clostridia bacterium]|nr:InlB B-repeat-containing protein [Clostridia bacterium]